MQDDDLASEAEVAAFIVKTNSQDQEYAKYVLDAFMAIQIENKVSYNATEDDIDAAIATALHSLPYKFAYSLNDEEMLGIHRELRNFTNIDSLYDFVDRVRDNIQEIWTTIKDSFNQQFCRVRYGGEFNTVSGNNGIWFRIASVDYNWDNVIYVFASDMRKKLNIEYITICRDPESDDSTDAYIYKAKDGTAYYNMPIDEFFTEEHEKNPVFATQLGAGVINSIRNELRRGRTLIQAYSSLKKSGIECSRDYRPYLLKKEIFGKCIEASQWFDELGTRTKMKISKMKTIVENLFPEIKDLEVDCKPRENSKGNPVGFEMLCKVKSDNAQLNDTVISIVSTKSLSSTMADRLASLFSKEYEDYIDYKGIRI
jgi:hypothetical protein